LGSSRGNTLEHSYASVKAKIVDSVSSERVGSIPSIRSAFRLKPAHLHPLTNKIGRDPESDQPQSWIAQRDGIYLCRDEFLYLLEIFD